MDEQGFTLHQVDQARTDFAIIEDNLELVLQLRGKTEPRSMLDLSLWPNMHSSLEEGKSYA